MNEAQNPMIVLMENLMEKADIENGAEVIDQTVKCDGCGKSYELSSLNLWKFGWRVPVSYENPRHCQKCIDENSLKQKESDNG